MGKYQAGSNQDRIEEISNTLGLMDKWFKDIAGRVNEKELGYIKQLRASRKANKKLKKQIGYLKKVHREFKDSLGFNMQRRVKVRVNRDINSGEFITSTDINTKVYTKNGIADLNEQDFELVRKNTDIKFLRYLRDNNVSIIGLDLDHKLIAFLNSVPMEMFQFLKDKREEYFKQELFNFKKNKSNNNAVKAGDTILTSHGAIGVTLESKNECQYVSVLLDSLHEPINETIHPLIYKQEVVIGEEAFEMIKKEADRKFIKWVKTQGLIVDGMSSYEELIPFMDNLPKEKHNQIKLLIDARENFLKKEITELKDRVINEDKLHRDVKLSRCLAELYHRENPYIKIQGL